VSRTRKSGELEAQVMDVLWRTSDPLTVREVREAFPARKPAYTTVSTVLERLRGKNMVTRSGSAAQGYRFAPSRSDDEHTSSLMLSALGSSQDREAALLKFAGNLDQGDVELLRKAFGG